MRIIQSDRLPDFVAAHPDAASSLRSWAALVNAAAWRNIVDVRRTYRYADPVKVASGRTVTVFNIRGNRYRLLVAIDYAIQVVNVLEFLTHAEYDTDRWKGRL